MRSKSGLTLFELLVVLAILASLAAAATVATDRVLARRRLEITQQNLTAFRRAVSGQYGIAAESAPGGTLAATNLEGFVADMGRLPLAVSEDATLQLGELWSNPGGMQLYGRKAAPGDAEVFVNCGWRGPYLDLPVGATALHDGWGRPFIVLTSDAGTPEPAAGGQPIFGLLSLGSDGAIGVTTTELPMAEDLTVWLGDPLSSPLHADLSVTVWQHDGEGGRTAPEGNGSLIVRLYLPDPTTGGVTFLQSTVLTGPFASAPQVAFADVPLGPKVFRAYWQDEEGNSSLSVPLDVTVTRGGVTHWDLLLPQSVSAEGGTP